MTACTGEIGVFPGQSKATAGEMIELGNPAVGSMAVAAEVTAGAIVNVIARMAIDTIARCALETIVRVTAGTTHILMPADQGKRRRRVIEPTAAPVVGFVTVSARLPETPGMGIVRFMTAAAARLSQSIISSVAVVTGDAALGLVGPGQREVRVRMIEDVGHESGDIGIPAQMLAMTQTALSRARIRMAAMKTRPAGHIFRHGFMAVEAQRRL